MRAPSRNRFSRESAAAALDNRRIELWSVVEAQEALAKNATTVEKQVEYRMCAILSRVKIAEIDRIKKELGL